MAPPPRSGFLSKEVDGGAAAKDDATPFMKKSAPHGYAAFRTLVEASPKPVVLLEGSREAPPEILARMEDLAEHLMRSFPKLVARTGNATGSDQAWARGINRVDPKRLELLLPRPSFQKGAIAGGNTVHALGDLKEEDRHAGRLVTRAQYEYRGRRGAAAFDGMPETHKPYLIRDALKVLGYEDYRGRCHKAIAGLFYVNPGRPNGGGTGQTIRVCEAEGVPVFLHEDWMTWNCLDLFSS